MITKGALPKALFYCLFGAIIQFQFRKSFIGHTTKWPRRVKVGWPKIWILGQDCQVKNGPNFDYEIWTDGVILLCTI